MNAWLHSYKLAPALLAVMLVVGTVEASTTGRCGGTGGTKTSTLTCPSGQYVVGVQARSGIFVDRIGIRCAPFGQDGKRGSMSAWQTGGGSGGTNANDKTCAVTDAVQIIDVSSGGSIDRVQWAWCKKRLPSGGFDEGPRSTALDIKMGGPGGIPCRIECPSGEAFYKLTLRHGAWLDSISGSCRP